jgi:integrase
VLNYTFLYEGIDKSNSARWKGCLDHVFAAPKKVSPVVHFNAIPYTQLLEVMQALRSNSNMSAYCRGMTWKEIDTVSKVWIIPPRRMKTGREHRVPLNDECMVILAKLDQFKSLGDETWCSLKN